jgi:hypothetical protein
MALMRTRRPPSIVIGLRSGGLFEEYGNVTLNNIHVTDTT